MNGRSSFEINIGKGVASRQQWYCTCNHNISRDKRYGCNFLVRGVSGLVCRETFEREFPDERSCLRVDNRLSTMGRMFRPSIFSLSSVSATSEDSSVLQSSQNSVLFFDCMVVQYSLLTGCPHMFNLASYAVAWVAE